MTGLDFHDGHEIVRRDYAIYLPPIDLDIGKNNRMESLITQP